MLKIMGKKILTILRRKVLFIDTYDKGLIIMWWMESFILFEKNHVGKCSAKTNAFQNANIIFSRKKIF